jgi:hypothetical protein
MYDVCYSLVFIIRQHQKVETMGLEVEIAGLLAKYFRGLMKTN